jgi:hypothetical protein
MPTDTIRFGDRVHDRDDPDLSDALVINLLPNTAEEWIAYGETTVAADNPESPPAAPIGVVVFVDAVEQPLPTWDRETPLAMETIIPSPLVPGRPRPLSGRIAVVCFHELDNLLDLVDAVDEGQDPLCDRTHAQPLLE